MLAVDFFLLARGGVAAGFVVQAARNHATDSEQEEGDSKHFAGGVVAARHAVGAWSERILPVTIVGPALCSAARRS